MFEKIEHSKGFYFLHSFHFVCKAEDRLAETSYGSNFTSAVNYKNIFGFQFHPEKSHSNGIALFKKFFGVENLLRARVIPCLLIQNKGLVKTKGFSEAKYVGDPINAVKIFNEKEADEIIVLDIDATKNRVGPDFAMISKLARE